MNLSRLNRVVRGALTICATGACLCTAAMAADDPPGTDIYVAKLGKNAKGFWQLSSYQQITTRKGYDNQPSFLPDGSGLLYTAMLPTQDGGYQADSFEYRFADKRQRNLTKSELSEYSPTLMHGGKVFSAVVVEKDSKQRLWAYPYAKKVKPYKLMNLEPIGYHVWGSHGDIAVFVLGDKSTLQYIKNYKTKPVVVAEDIGRSLRYTPSRNGFSFTQKHSDGRWWLSEYNADSQKVTSLVPMPKGSGYYTWIDDKTAVTAVGKTLHLWQYRVDSKAMEADWVPWVDVSEVCSTKVTRLAVSHNSDKLAFVCDE